MNYLKKISESIMTLADHGFDHIERVMTLCRTISKGMDVDRDVLEASVYLHDIGMYDEDTDSSGDTDHASRGAILSEPYLKKAGFTPDKIEHIKDCIRSHRFKSDIRPKTDEAKILFDADKLDSLGAIGLARAFAWIGKHNARLYHVPDDIDEYNSENLGENGRIKDKSLHSTQIEWENKYKFIVDRLHYEISKEIAKERSQYFTEFNNRLKKEIDGEL